MASGILGAEDLAAASNTTIYTVPTDTVATVTVNMTNRNPATGASIRIALTDGALTLADYIEYDALICSPGGVIERSGIVLGAGQSVIARSDTANVSAQVWGWEEPE